MEENETTKVPKALKTQAAAYQAAKKKLAEMNLLDDFLFGSVVTSPEIGERFVRILLKTIFDREFGRLSVIAQKVFYGTDSDLHGARLDVCIEPDKEGSEGRATVYDVEPDQNEKETDKKALPRRVRFYHGKIVAKSLNSNTNYINLKDVIIIMILPYDPFGLERMMYTVKNRCLEEPQMEYEDGASTLFLYTRGTKEIPSIKLKQFLRYMEKSIYINAVNDDLKEVHRMVEIVKFDAETTISCVRLTEKLERSIEEGREAGRAEGRAEGRVEGMAEGRAEGIAEGKAIGEARGDLLRLVTLVCKKMRLGQLPEKIAEDLVEDISAIEAIYHAAQESAPEYDPEAVLKALEGGNQDGTGALSVFFNV